MVYVVNLEKVTEEDLAKGDGRATKVRYLIDQRHGAENFFLRVYEVQPGGQTPYDQHPHEHEVYVLKGRAKLLTKSEGETLTREIMEGDAIFIASNQVHQFINDGKESFRMLCVRGAGETQPKQLPEKESAELQRRSG